MRTQTYEESFGRIGRRQPVTARPLQAGHSRERDVFISGRGQSAIELHAAARADRSRRIGDFAAFFFRFMADKAARLLAGPLHSSNFWQFQPKE